MDGEADFVNGSRRLGRTYSTDPVRNLGVVVFGTLVTVLTGVRITDPANGLRAMRAEITEVVPLHQPQYQTSELLITTIAHGFRVKEVPATMHERRSGGSKKGPQSDLRGPFRPSGGHDLVEATVDGETPGPGSEGPLVNTTRSYTTNLATKTIPDTVR